MGHCSDFSVMSGGGGGGGGGGLSFVMGHCCPSFSVLSYCQVRFFTWLIVSEEAGQVQEDFPGGAGWKLPHSADAR